MVFFCAMLSMSAAASVLAAIAVQRGYLGQVANVFAGLFAFYLVGTGWFTVRRPAGPTSRIDFIGLTAVLVIACVAASWLLPMTLGPKGPAHGVPVAAPIILAAVATLLAALDLKVILRRGVAARVEDHASSMADVPGPLHRQRIVLHRSAGRHAGQYPRLAYPAAARRRTADRYGILANQDVAWREGVLDASPAGLVPMVGDKADRALGRRIHLHDRRRVRERRGRGGNRDLGRRWR